MFDIKTPKRVYYLAADCEADMTAWVDWVCQVNSNNLKVLFPNLLKVQEKEKKAKTTEKKS